MNEVIMIVICTGVFFGSVEIIVCTAFKTPFRWDDADKLALLICFVAAIKTVLN